MTINISIMTHDDPRFYPLLGPYLANRVVAEAYGDKIWDDAGDTWAIACTREGAVMGFAALRPSKRGRNLQLCNDYVVPAYRDDQNTVQVQLLEALLVQCPTDVTVTVVAAASEKEFYEERGWTQQGLKGSFSIMRKSIGEEKKA